MTRFDSTHFVLSSEDELRAQGTASLHSATLYVGSAMSMSTIAMTFQVEHLPYLQQLVDLLWATKDEQQATAVQERKDQEAIAVEKLVA
jgi:hypothetical protein